MIICGNTAREDFSTKAITSYIREKENE